MPGGLTRKLDYEKGKRRQSVNKEDYHERILAEGDNFDRGGEQQRKLISFQDSELTMDLRPFYQDDKKSLLATLQSHWQFIIDGQVGSIARLRKNPKVSEKVKERFEIMQKSILRADEIIGMAEHPETKRQYYVVEFRCNIRPVEPLPNPIFKKRLAFSAKLVGPALSDS
jgi:hypothetical protein